MRDVSDTAFAWRIWSVGAPESQLQAFVDDATRPRSLDELDFCPSPDFSVAVNIVLDELADRLNRRST